MAAALRALGTPALRVTAAYVGNLLGERRSQCSRIRTSNKAFRSLGSDGELLLSAAGFERDESGAELRLSATPPPDTAIGELHAALAAELAARAFPFDRLPPDVLARILRPLSVRELCAWRQSARAHAAQVHELDLFARVCAPLDVALNRARMDVAPGAGDGGGWPDWQRLWACACAWRHLRARASRPLLASLRPGLEPGDALRVWARARAPDTADGGARGPAPPADVLASLLWHDGQEAEGALCGSLVGQGLRLLSLDEMCAPRGVAGTAAAARGLLPLTTLDGMHQLAADPADGSVWLCAGFEATYKASSWLELLHRLAVDTV